MRLISCKVRLLYATGLLILIGCRPLASNVFAVQPYGPSRLSAKSFTVNLSGNSLRCLRHFNSSLRIPTDYGGYAATASPSMSLISDWIPKFLIVPYSQRSYISISSAMAFAFIQLDFDSSWSIKLILASKSNPAFDSFSQNKSSEHTFNQHIEITNLSKIYKLNTYNLLLTNKKQEWYEPRYI